MALAFRFSAYGFPDTEVGDSLFSFRPHTTGMHGTPATHRGAAASCMHSLGSIDMGDPRRTKESQALVRHLLCFFREGV